jgi:hypothetical protein
MLAPIMAFTPSWLGSRPRRRKLLVFEPYPPVLKILNHNVQANGLEDRIDIRPIALSDSAGGGHPLPSGPATRSFRDELLA